MTAAVPASARPLLRKLEGSARALDLAGCRVLVAVSGGADSTVLLAALAELAPRLSIKLAAGHVNHGLRGAESDADEAAVRALGDRLGIGVAAARVDPGALRVGRSSRERPTLEEAARTLRYRALSALAAGSGSDRIATAHTADDQAETVLLRLLRGTGPDGLGGIPERSPDGRVVRPLLRVTREEIERFARERGLSWREDTSNRSDRFTRNRLRTRWIPRLAEEFNPRLLRALTDLAEAQRRDSDWIDGQVEREMQRRVRVEALDGSTEASPQPGSDPPGPDPPDRGRGEVVLWLERHGWADLPEALARRLVRRTLQRCGGGRDVSRVHLERVLGFLREGRSGTWIELPGDRVLTCERDAFRLRPRRLTGGGSC